MANLQIQLSDELKAQTQVVTTDLCMDFHSVSCLPERDDISQVCYTETANSKLAIYVCVCK